MKNSDSIMSMIQGMPEESRKICLDYVTSIQNAISIYGESAILAVAYVGSKLQEQLEE